MSKILIAYYSHSKNTERIANIIAAKTKGDIFKIEPLKPYPTSYNAVVEQAKTEIMSGFLPEINDKGRDFSAYEAIFVGTPNWWSTMAPPVKTFLTNNDFTYKKLGVFCTHGGGGGGHILRDVKNLCPYSAVRELLQFYGNGGSEAEAAVERWLKTSVGN